MPTPELLRTVYSSHMAAMNFITYRLAQQSNYYARYTCRPIQRQAKHTAQMIRPNTLTERDLISFLSFICQFRNAGEVHDIHEGAALWLMTHFLSGKPKDKIEDYLCTEGYETASQSEDATRT